jgi:hypothetical protein
MHFLVVSMVIPDALLVKKLLQSKESIFSSCRMMKSIINGYQAGKCEIWSRGLVSRYPLK